MTSSSGALASAISNPWLIVFGLFAVYLVQKILAYKKLEQFRGPPGTGFSDFFHSRALLRLKCHEWYGEVTTKYGTSKCHSLSRPINTDGVLQVQLRELHQMFSSPPPPTSGSAQTAYAPHTRDLFGTIEPYASRQAEIISCLRQTIRSTRSGGSRWLLG
jgi:hypothetical protein